jgi:hypothetical protein
MSFWRRFLGRAGRGTNPPPSPAAPGKRQRSKADLVYVCKDPGQSQAEMEASANRAENVIREFESAFPDCLAQVPAIEATAGTRLVIKMQVYFNDREELFRMKEYGDGLVVKYGLSDFG